MFVSRQRQPFVDFIVGCVKRSATRQWGKTIGKMVCFAGAAHTRLQSLPQQSANVFVSLSWTVEFTHYPCGFATFTRVHCVNLRRHHTLVCLAKLASMHSLKSATRGICTAFSEYKGYTMKTIRLLFLAVFFMSASLAVTPAVAGGPGGCPPWRPCGPGNSFGGNRLISQGGFGVDFRSSCASHDACLASGVSRRQCDQQFHSHMRCACENSRHPILCRMKAFKFFAGARIFGGLYH